MTEALKVDVKTKVALTLVSPGALVHCVLHQQDSSRPPHLSAVEALLLLFPSGIKEVNFKPSKLSRTCCKCTLIVWTVRVDIMQKWKFSLYDFLSLSIKEDILMNVQSTVESDRCCLLSSLIKAPWNTDYSSPYDMQEVTGWSCFSCCSACCVSYDCVRICRHVRFEIWMLGGENFQ